MIKQFLQVLLAGLASTAVASLAPNLAQNLQVISADGPEGRGNVEAAAAWKKLPASNADTLIPVLEGIDGANAISHDAIYFRSDARLWKIGKSPSKPPA